MNLTLIIALILVLSSALAAMLGVGLGRTSAHSDRVTEQAFRGLMLARLARRFGDRRQGDRRVRTRPIAHELRAGDRRVVERRVDTALSDQGGLGPDGPPTIRRVA